MEDVELRRTEFRDGTAYLGEFEFIRLMKQLIHHYQFRGDGELPSKIVLPIPDEVEGVEIELVEVEKHAITS